MATNGIFVSKPRNKCLDVVNRVSLRASTIYVGKMIWLRCIPVDNQKQDDRVRLGIAGPRNAKA